MAICHSWVEPSGSVDAGCVEEFLGERQEELSEQEDTEGAGDERHDQGEVGVDPS